MSILASLWGYSYWIFLASSFGFLIYWFIGDTKTSRILYSEGQDDLMIVKRKLRDMKFMMYKGKHNEKTWDLSHTKPKMLATQFGLRPFYRVDKDSLTPLNFDSLKVPEKLNPEFMASFMKTKIFKDILSVSAMSDNYMMWAMIFGAGAMMGYIVGPMIKGGLL